MAIALISFPAREENHMWTQFRSVCLSTIVVEFILKHLKRLASKSSMDHCPSTLEACFVNNVSIWRVFDYEMFSSFHRWFWSDDFWAPTIQPHALKNLRHVVIHEGHHNILQTHQGTEQRQLENLIREGKVFWVWRRNLWSVKRTWKPEKAYTSNSTCQLEYARGVLY